MENVVRMENFCQGMNGGDGDNLPDYDVLSNNENGNDGVHDMLNYFFECYDYYNNNDASIATQVTRESFEKLLREAQHELYPGCLKFSTLSFTIKLLHLKVYNKWSNKSFDMLLKLLRDALPEGQTLLKSHCEVTILLRDLGLGLLRMVLGRKAASASCRLSNNVRINSSEQLAMQSRNQRAPSLIRTTPSTSIIKVTGSTSTEKGRGPTRGKEFQRINEANNKRMAVCIDPVQGRPFDKMRLNILGLQTNARVTKTIKGLLGARLRNRRFVLHKYYKSFEFDEQACQHPLAKLVQRDWDAICDY
ncbi:hypothetical protein GH714_026022 [Hevea brasiliensis]|uniref:Uncharacterized protein n=1 Tax=Hevea brasiliensis TaxID=3981 RepID=A0A6A6M5P2_HEVBR|nr:hypothetical protein GH714_026022 [Hevea brasiliensis]